MKRILMFVMMIVLATAMAASAGDEKKTAAAADEKGKDKGETVTLTGEVLDLYCYMSHPESATGAEHAKCANSCISRGLPIGFLTADGTVYVIIGSDHSPANELVKDWAGKQSTITGTLMQHKGMKAIDITGIGAVKS